ncbi:MAG: glycosyltransferase family 2 protein [Actinomycetota bacterium]
MPDPLFSVIIPTYGRQQFLEAAVGSVLAQTVDDLEVVVVDDASPEPAVIPADPRVRSVRRTENGGSGAARNTGIEAARGLYVTFLDDDDEFTPRRLAIALEGLERAPIAVCWGQYLGGPPGRGRTLDGDVSDTILDGIAPHTGRTALVRELCPRFDERFRGSEDVEWWLRLAQLGSVATVPEPGYLFRLHPGPRHGKGTHVRIQDRLDIMDLHREYFDAHPRATAFAWKRIGLMALGAGDSALARRAFVKSLRLERDPKLLWHLARALRPGSG